MMVSQASTDWSSLSRWGYLSSGSSLTLFSLLNRSKTRCTIMRSSTNEIEVCFKMDRPRSSLSWATISSIQRFRPQTRLRMSLVSWVKTDSPRMTVSGSSFEIDRQELTSTNLVIKRHFSLLRRGRKYLVEWRQGFKLRFQTRNLHPKLLLEFNRWFLIIWQQ